MSKNLGPNQIIEKTPAPEDIRFGSVKRTWHRIRRNEPISEQPGWTPQEKAEESALRDLEKPIEQLLSDIHEAHEMRRTDLKSDTPKKEHRDPILLTLSTLKRTASMMAVVAKSNDSLARANIAVQNSVRYLTKWITILTIGLFAIGVIQLVLIILQLRRGQ